MVSEPLRHFLPGLYQRQLEGGSDDIGMLIDQLVATSEEMSPRTKWNELDEDEIRGAYHWIIRALSQISPGEADYIITHDLTSKLEERLATDCNDAREMTGGSYFHRRCQHLFRALAEVSHRTQSFKLGRILLQFFSRNASLITTDNSLALGQWCYALLRATTHESERLECLKKVLRARPDLSRAIHDRGRKARDVADVLDRVASYMGRRELKPRVHDHLDLYPHQHLSGLHDGVALDSFGAELAGFGQMRARSRSRDRRLMPLHRGFDRRMVEERAYAIPDQDEQLAYRAERLLLVQEEQGRRMLQLSMGRNYVDHLGVHGMGVGEPLAPRAVRFPQLSELEYDI